VKVFGQISTVHEALLINFSTTI